MKLQYRRVANSLPYHFQGPHIWKASHGGADFVIGHVGKKVLMRVKMPKDDRFQDYHYFSNMRAARALNVMTSDEVKKNPKPPKKWGPHSRKDVLAARRSLLKKAKGTPRYALLKKRFKDADK